ncbi:MAG: hypothetical protein WBA67_08230 [Jannaschia sp.]
MLRTLAIAILSATLALPLTTAPARAEARDVAKVLGGVAALVILNEALSNRGQATARPAPVYRQPQVQYRQPQVQYRQPQLQYREPQVRYQRHQPVRRAGPPQHCLRQVRTDRGLRNVYSERCLARSGWIAHSGRR